MKNKEWHDTQFQSHMHFIPGGTVRLRLRAFQVFSRRKTKGIRERKTGAGRRWGGGKEKRNRIKKISMWTKCIPGADAQWPGEHGSVGWAHSCCSQTTARPCHPHVTLGDRKLAPHSESKPAPQRGENVGDPEKPFMRHPQPSVPSARESLGMMCWCVLTANNNIWTQLRSMPHSHERQQIADLFSANLAAAALQVTMPGRTKLHMHHKPKRHLHAQKHISNLTLPHFECKD